MENNKAGIKKRKINWHTESRIEYLVFIPYQTDTSIPPLMNGLSKNSNHNTHNEKDAPTGTINSSNTGIKTLNFESRHNNLVSSPHSVDLQIFTTDENNNSLLLNNRK